MNRLSATADPLETGDEALELIDRVSISSQVIVEVILATSMAIYAYNIYNENHLNNSKLCLLL